jgi:hypothetical protein
VRDFRAHLPPELLTELGTELSCAAVAPANPPGRKIFDPLGFDLAYYDRLLHEAEPLLAWFVTQLEGLGEIPRRGPALILFDCDPRRALSLALQYAVRRLHPAHRPMRPLISEDRCRSAVVWHLATRYAGATIEHPANVDYLLERGSLTIAYPNRDQWTTDHEAVGDAAVWRSHTLRIALRRRVPIIPVAQLRGAGEIRPMLRSPLPASRQKLLVAAKRAFEALPSRWQMHILPPVESTDLGSGTAAEIRELTKRIHDHIHGRASVRPRQGV